MTAVELMKLELQRLHASYDKVLTELTPDQLHRVPAGHPKANTIAWGVWHYVRTEDNVVRYILQNRRPIVWAEGGYADKLGLPPVAQGTGMSTEESQALRIKDLGLFREYTAKVWASTDEYLAKVDPATLDTTVTIKPLGDMPAIRALAQVCVGHGFMHVGEIELARTLVGQRRVIAGGPEATFETLLPWREGAASSPHQAFPRKVEELSEAVTAMVFIEPEPAAGGAAAVFGACARRLSHDTYMVWKFRPSLDPLFRLSPSFPTTPTVYAFTRDARLLEPLGTYAERLPGP